MRALILLFVILFANINVYQGQTYETRENSWLIVDSLTTFVCPDSAFDSIRNILLSANHSIDIMVYEFWSQDIYNIIDNVTSRGVRVRVLLEGDTYSEHGTQWNMNMSSMLYELRQRGRPVEIRLEQSDSFMHAKMMIIDGSIVILGSENYMPTSYPSDPNIIELQPYTTASRGWGVIIRDYNFAQQCMDIFEEIYGQSEEYDPSKHGTGSAPCYNGELSYVPRISVSSKNNVDVVLVKTPGNALNMIKWMIDKANYTILIQQMYIKSTDSFVSEILDALKRARECGVTVHIIVEDDPIGNYDDVKSTLTSMGFHVVPAFKYASMLFLHNKGIIVDDCLVFVGSINWSGAALVSNTEVGVIIRSRDIGKFFREAYALDWNYSSTTPFDSDGDGLSDYFEKEHGFDPYKRDSDGDGVSDYDEVYVYGNVATYSSVTKPSRDNTTIIIAVIVIVLLIIIVVLLMKRRQ